MLCTKYQDVLRWVIYQIYPRSFMVYCHPLLLIRIDYCPAEIPGRKKENTARKNRAGFERMDNHVDQVPGGQSPWYDTKSSGSLFF